MMREPELLDDRDREGAGEPEADAVAGGEGEIGVGVREQRAAVARLEVAVVRHAGLELDHLVEPDAAADVEEPVRGVDVGVGVARGGAAARVRREGPG